MNVRLRIALLAVSMLARPAAIQADSLSTGPTGINSQVLNDAYDLTGQGIVIGELEWGRAGLPGFDSSANTHPNVKPAAVFFQDGPASPNAHITAHATRVAGGLISDHPIHRSVSPNVSLYSSATGELPLPNIDGVTLRSLQHLALQNGGDVRTIQINDEPTNGSHTFNGSSLFTLGLDWSARQHDVLYVIPRGNVEVTNIMGKDNFNGVTIAASQKDGSGVYRQVWTGTSFGNASNGRRLTTLMAPGADVTVPLLGADHDVFDGTSHSIWHATGTVALLQQYADARIAEGAAHWNVDARRHEVMKAVLLNSADKLQDTGDGRRLGMEKTILRRNGTTWLDSTTASASRTIPLDNEMGTGQLNAYRAWAQFAAGEANAGLIPSMGWDYGTTLGTDGINKYVFDTPLAAQSYVTISLAWDRLVDLNDTNGNGLYDIGEGFISPGMSNLDLFLLPKDATDFGQAVWSSESTLYNVEHLLFNIPSQGEYEFWVRQTGVSPHPGGGQVFAVAWQAVAVPEPAGVVPACVTLVALGSSALRRRAR